MDRILVQITFPVSVPRATFEQEELPGAAQIAAVAGLQWKIWALNEAEQTFCGTYLFDDAATAAAFVGGPLIAPLKDVPHVTIRRYAVLDRLTARTRGPVSTTLAAG